MTVGRSAWLVFAVFAVGFLLLLQAERSGDLLIRSLIWSAILLATGYEVVRLWRGKAHSTDQTAGMPSKLRRWLFGESGPR